MERIVVNLKKYKQRPTQSDSITLLRKNALVWRTRAP